MTRLVHHHLLAANNATVILLRLTAPSDKPVRKSMNTGALVTYFHQLKIVTGQNQTPVLDAEQRHELQGQLGQI